MDRRNFFRGLFALPIAAVAAPLAALAPNHLLEESGIGRKRLRKLDAKEHRGRTCDYELAF